jgi:hypothetical protein
MTVLSQGHEGMVDRAARKGFLAMVVVVLFGCGDCDLS